MSKAKGGGGGRGGGVHTTRKPGGSGWINQADGKVLSEHRLKDRAVDKGREQAKDLSTEHTIHGRDGTIQEKNSYGNDPPKKKG